MGCFLGCFGLSSNKKRRKPTRKILPRDQRICIYEPLHSSDPTNLNIPENPEKSSNSYHRCGAEEKKESKTKKRVRFNLNVQTYEPIPRTHENTCSDEAEKPEDSGVKSSYPSNYRYQNSVDCYGEVDDETDFGESDLEDEDYYTEDDYEDDADDEGEGEGEKEEVMYHGGEEVASSDAEELIFGSTGRSQYATQVLNPVQNLAQWKAIKARPVKVKQPRKENIEAAKLLQEMAVDASLSNWLASPENFNEKGSSKRCLLERSPILDITNLETW